MRLLARLVVVLGAVAVAWTLFGEGPRTVTLVYELPPVARGTTLEIEIRRGGETVRRAEFRLAAGPDGRRQVRHEVRLAEGDYDLAWRLALPDGGSHGVRSVSVREDGTLVFSLGP